MKVWIFNGDYIEGTRVLAVFDHEPTDEDKQEVINKQESQYERYFAHSFEVITTCRCIGRNIPGICPVHREGK